MKSLWLTAMRVRDARRVLRAVFVDVSASRCGDAFAAMKRGSEVAFIAPELGRAVRNRQSIPPTRSVANDNLPAAKRWFIRERE